MESYSPKKIFVDYEVQNHWMAQRILNYYSTIPFSIIHSSKDISSIYCDSEDPITIGKEYLFITKNRGRFVKKCPGTNGFICCNYYVIDLVENCHLECSYCFLQSYLTDKMIKVYINVEDLFIELDHLLDDSNNFYRIGTGELSDSLALDEATNFSSLLVEYFAKKENALLELKTKTNLVNNLLNLQSKGHSVISWSLNPDCIIKSEEHKTSSLKDRLEAAYQCQASGYQLGFHFDPIVYYADWKRDYADIIDRLFDKIDSNRIAWISLGGFRYNPSLHKVIEQRFRQSSILYEEFLESPDGKMRYFIKIREELYRSMIKMIKEKDPNLMIYLCMEGKYIWKKVYGFTPQNNNNLDRLFRLRQQVTSKRLLV